MTFPLVLTPQQIDRVRRSSRLILTRRLPVGHPVDVHNETLLRGDEDPRAFTIEVDAFQRRWLGMIEDTVLRRAGFKSYEEFYEDWMSHRKRFHADQEVFVHEYRVAADARFLHERVHRGYTTDPAEAVRGEGQALTRGELEELAARNRLRFDSSRREERTRERLRTLAIRLKEASRRGDLEASRAIRLELERLEQEAA